MKKTLALACAWVVLTAQATAPLDLAKEALFRGLLEKADTAMREGKPELAHDLYVQAEGQSEESADADIGQVRADLLAGEFRRASAFALLVSGEHPDSTEALAIGAFLEERAGQTDRAVDFLKKSLAKSPDSVPLVGALAEILIDRGRYQDATQILDGWIRAHRAQPEIALLRARVMPTSGVASGTRAGEGRWPAPYFELFPQDIKGKSVNGFVIDDGSRVVTLAAAVSQSGIPLYVRNGLGRLRQARLEKKAGELAILRLEEPYEPRWSLSQLAAPVPGRAASVVGFGVVDRRAASWPALTAGWVVQPQGKGPLRMSAELPESVAGSPVFDPQGRLVGAIAPHVAGADAVVIPTNSLQSSSSEPPASLAPVPPKELMERVQGAVVVVLIPN